jgi:hypothetical protein
MFHNKQMRNDLDGGEMGSLRQQPNTSLQPAAMSRFVEFVVDCSSSPVPALARLPWLWLSSIR